MNQTKIQHEVNNIHHLIKNRQLKEAIDKIKNLLASQQNWSISERLSEIETNYKYMLHYLIEGQKDPEQHKIYNKLVRDIYTIIDDTADHLLIHESSSLFYDKMRINNITDSLTIDEYRESISKYSDTFSFIELLEDDSEKDSRINQHTQSYEKLIKEMFYSAFISPRVNEDTITSFYKFINDDVISIQDKSMLISAVTMNIMQRFDPLKILFLLDACLHREPEIATRAIVGIIPIFQIYENRLNIYPECVDRLKLHSDDATFTRRFMTAILGYIQAHETEKITKKLTEEIFPEMMKLSPMIGKKIKLDEWMGETGFDDKNPEWQKILEESGLSDKLKEFSEMQIGGADVFHSTFANLKNYPFFQEMSNWFLPFNPKHSSIHNLFSDQQEGKQLIETMFQSSLICNSDKYSFCFSIMMMPENYRGMMINQLGAEGEEIKKMQEEELALKPNQKEETIIKQYIQDLYRFFKLFPKSKNLIDIFNLPLNFHEIEAFSSLVLNYKNLEQIALYYFEKNNFKEAKKAYLILSEIGPPKSEMWQKIGYCKQMLGNIRGALKAYLHADLIEENNTWLLGRIAYCYRVLKEPNTALEYYRRLEQFRPDDLNIQLNIGHCYLELKQYDDALNYYFKVELANNNNTRAWRSIAWCAFLSRKFDIAQNYYNRILEKKPNSHDYLNAGHVELCLNNNARAVQFYKLSQQSAGSFKSFRSMLADDENELKEAGIDTDILPVIIDSMQYDQEG